jgi:hypothetical protein
LLERIASEGTLAHIDEVPEDVRDVFVCAHDITPEWHMKMQAAFQRHCDASISKTINFPKAAARGDVDKIYRLAFELNCKGVTVYRDGCRDHQPMALKKNEGTEAERQEGTKRESADDSPSASGSGNGNGHGHGEEHGSGNGNGKRHAAQRRDAEPARAAVVESTVRRVKPLEPRDLPEIVSGLRIRQMTPFGNMHVKITVDPRADVELEVFAQLGKGGDVANSDLEAICRMISLWLRAGGTLKHVIKQLEGIGSSLQIPTRTGRIMSLGDGLASALKKYRRAKERFGLRALLIGEVDPAEIDNPLSPPHSARTGPIDRAVSAEGVRVTHVVREELRPDAIRGDGDLGAPAAKGQAAAGGNGDPSVNAAASPAVASATAVAAPDRETSARVTTISGSAAARTVTEVASAPVRREVHNPATHYKIKCPECGGGLMQQEGCRKCPGCGWSAC